MNLRDADPTLVGAVVATVLALVAMALVVVRSRRPDSDPEMSVADPVQAVPASARPQVTDPLLADLVTVTEAQAAHAAEEGEVEVEAHDAASVGVTSRDIGPASSLASIVESVAMLDDPALVVDDRGVIAGASRAATDLFGLRPHEHFGRVGPMRLLTSTEALAEREHPIARSLAGVSVEARPYIVDTPSGAVAVVATTRPVMVDKTQHVVAYFRLANPAKRSSGE